MIQDDDMEEEEDDLEDSCGDGFVVPNGYISEDEGVGSVQQDLDDLAAELEGARLTPSPLQSMWQSLSRLDKREQSQG